MPPQNQHALALALQDLPMQAPLQQLQRHSEDFGGYVSDSSEQSVSLQDCKMSLISTPCQWTESKTYTAIENMKYLKDIGISSGYDLRQNRLGRNHRMIIVFTNKSLTETDQWLGRIEVLEGLRIKVLSSVAKTSGGYQDVNCLLGNIISAKERSEIPDILIMCAHKTRVKDTETLVVTLARCAGSLKHIGIEDIDFTIMFDEADKNETLTYTAHFIEKTGILTGQCPQVKELYLITATPFNNFWKRLAGMGIHTLYNAKHAFCGRDMSYDELLNQYRQIDDNDIEFFPDNHDGPVDYARRVMESPKFNKPLKNSMNSKVVFAPSGKTVGSHMDMKDMFLEKGYDCLVINGGKKGFYSHSEEGTVSFQKIKQFNKKHNIKTGQLYDTLVKYKEVHSGTNIGITGHICINRGVTFNTTDFNFTDSIISNSHYDIKNPADLIQFLGRSTGDKAFIEKHYIWIPEDIKNITDEYVQIQFEVLRLNPEFLNKTNFQTVKEKGVDFKKAEKIVAQSVPILIELDDEVYDEIREECVNMGNRGFTYDTEDIKSAILENYDDQTIFNGRTRMEISTPWDINFNNGSDKGKDSYIKNILNRRDQANNDIKSTGLIKDKFKYKKTYSIYFNFKNKDIIVHLYNGHLIAKETNLKP